MYAMCVYMYAVCIYMHAYTYITNLSWEIWADVRHSQCRGISIESVTKTRYLKPPCGTAVGVCCCNGAWLIEPRFGVPGPGNVVPPPGVGDLGETGVDCLGECRAGRGFLAGDRCFSGDVGAVDCGARLTLPDTTSLRNASHSARMVCRVHVGCDYLRRVHVGRLMQ